jgi:hypothetical protein
MQENGAVHAEDERPLPAFASLEAAFSYGLVDLGSADAGYRAGLRDWKALTLEIWIIHARLSLTACIIASVHGKCADQNNIETDNAGLAAVRYGQSLRARRIVRGCGGLFPNLPCIARSRSFTRGGAFPSGQSCFAISVISICRAGNLTWCLAGDIAGRSEENSRKTGLFHLQMGPSSRTRLLNKHFVVKLWFPPLLIEKWRAANRRIVREQEGMLGQRLRYLHRGEIIVRDFLWRPLEKTLPSISISLVESGGNISATHLSHNATFPRSSVWVPARVQIHSKAEQRGT